MSSKRRRWDVASKEDGAGAPPVKREEVEDEWESEVKMEMNPGAMAWETPAPGMAAKVESVDATPMVVRRNRWDETPAPGAKVMPGETPKVAGAKASRWDATPAVSQMMDVPEKTPVYGAFGETPQYGKTPFGPGFGATPSFVPQTPAVMKDVPGMKSLTDEELDAILPTEGYQIMEVPEGYVPVKNDRGPVALGVQDGFFMREENAYTAAGNIGTNAEGMIEMPEGLPSISESDKEMFKSLMAENQVDEDMLDSESRKERQILTLLLKIKNGEPHMRKIAMRQITDRATEFGPAALFNQILPLLVNPNLDDLERHLLVKVIDRVLYKLDHLVRPFTQNILVVIEPLLIDEDYFARVEGREIISNLAKAAGLATMIATLRPDIDHHDEYVRNTTARTLSVVASALGIPALLPFLKAACRSKKSWEARHTGIKVVQQTAILMGCAVLPHLHGLVETVAPGLNDVQIKVRTMAALALSSLAEAAAPYGIESFDQVLSQLWEGIANNRGKTLAAFLKAAGCIVPLMDPENAAQFTARMMPVVIREFASPDDEMRRIVLKVIKQIIATDGVSAEYVRNEIAPHYFSAFWTRRNALEKRLSKQLVETTTELGKKVGCYAILSCVKDYLKDENEAMRRMTSEAIEKTVAILGTADIDQRLEKEIIDGFTFAFQEQSVEYTSTQIILDGFGTYLNSLGVKVKPYIVDICSIVKWQLNNKSSKVRQQAADFIARIAHVIKDCGEEDMLCHLGRVLYEYLGEEYPEVLGSILGGLKAIVSVVGMHKMDPPIKELVPRLTPIMKNRHEKVEENVIDLIGIIADRGADPVSSREWMRICFELLEMLNAHKKGIRRAAINTFGYIAKAIGPSDVMATLLNNLKVQERQNRVCTTIAIAAVAESCGPFTVLPALMTEYRVPEQNVQNGVLKSLSFVFEYIGEVGKDYIYSIATLLEDALIDRDFVHRQTACSVIKHAALDVWGMGCEDVLMHLLNYCWPNVFETSPHIAIAFADAIEGLRVSLGAGTLLMYILPGLFHPARKVRNAYWRVYNSVYIGSSNALIAFYPRVPDDGFNRYAPTELDLML